MRTASPWIAFLLFLPAVLAGDLRRETLNAWNEYIDAANHAMLERLRPDHSFLWIDEHPEFARRLREHDLVIMPAAEPNPKRVPYGLIHHWIGAVFLPDVRLEDVLAIVRDYDHYKNFYPSAVLSSEAIDQDGADDQFSLLLMSRAVLAKIALLSEDRATYYQLDSRRWYCTSYTTRVQEVDGYGESDQRTLPPDHGHGYIWRLYGISRFEERDGGVYLEIEAIALSRDIPAAIRWIVEPIVRRVARDSMSVTLRRTEQAVSGAAAAAAYRSASGIRPR